MDFRTGPRTILFSLGAHGLALLALVTTAGQAASLDELRFLAHLPAVDLAKLKSGEIVSEQGSPGDFPRGIFLESCYFIQAPMEAVGDGLLHWNPLPHRELEVRLYREYGLPGARQVFQKLQLSPGIADDRWLLAQTAHAIETGQAGDLHLTSEEVARLRQNKSMPASEAWQEILHRRSESLIGGGLAAVAPYGADNSISPATELRGLLSLAPTAARHFQPITQSQPIVANGKPASDAVGYWDAARVHNHTTLELGFLAAQKGRDSWQLVDCVYYPSDTYFMALDLFQLWPVEGGTLVWRVSFVSAPFRTYLGGVDRYVAGKQMVGETLDTIKAFRADIEKRR